MGQRWREICAGDNTLSIFDWFRRKEEPEELSFPMDDVLMHQRSVNFDKHRNEIIAFLKTKVCSNNGGTYTINDGFCHFLVNKEGLSIDPFVGCAIPAVCISDDESGELRFYAAKTVLPNAEWGK